MSSTEEDSHTASQDALSVLESLPDETATPLHDFAQGNVPAEELDFKDWTEPMELDERVWLLLIDVESSIMVWVHYDEDIDDLCCHPINDWDPYTVQTDNLKETLSNPDDAIKIEVKLQSETPMAD